MQHQNHDLYIKEGKSNKLDLTKIKTFFSVKDTFNKMKKATDWEENIYSSHIWQKSYIQNI